MQSTQKQNKINYEIKNKTTKHLIKLKLNKNYKQKITIK